jgi:hypothetical protein
MVTREVHESTCTNDITVLGVFLRSRIFLAISNQFPNPSFCVVVAVRTINQWKRSIGVVAPLHYDTPHEHYP